ncbi:MAG: CoA activase [Desulfobacterium sp.]|nr:CoA activase [Desulfobacterium sp.]MBU3946861.1 CoA activase [Pseudomonadota bacterium]MBU4035322.1 CoA activase [Pseudomonadota bacterium]
MITAITAGIDLGAKTVKVVILKGKEVIGRGIATTGLDQKKSAEKAFDAALKEAKIDLKDLDRVVATGVGRTEAPNANSQITEVGADAKGAIFLNPAIRTVIDIGGEEGRGIKISPEGRAVDFAINEKCAAGAGAFTEAMARALERPLKEFAELALKSTKSIPMNAQCAVFAESEVVSLIHAKTPHEDISRAVHDSIADRIISMVRRVGIEKEVLLIGGVAHNVGFVNSLNIGLKLEVIVPEYPEFIGALGAALVAAEQQE